MTFWCVACSLAQVRDGVTMEKPWQVGIVLEPMVLDRLVSPPAHNRFAPRLPTALVLKHYFHPKNSFNIYLGRGAADGLTNYRTDRKYWFNGFNVAAGYEHAFLAPRRFNVLTGLKLNYTYSREVLSEFSNRNIHFPQLLKFHSEMGPGVDLGMRYRLSKRFNVESNVSMSRLWPMPHNTTFNAWRRDGHFSIRRFLSFELHYHFGR